LIEIIILEENFKWHLEAFASELFIYECWDRCHIPTWISWESTDASMTDVTCQNYCYTWFRVILFKHLVSNVWNLS